MEERPTISLSIITNKVKCIDYNSITLYLLITVLIVEFLINVPRLCYKCASIHRFFINSKTNETKIVLQNNF